MSLQCEVMYLDSGQIDKLGELKSRFGFSTNSEAVRFVLDAVDPNTIGDNTEIVYWSHLLRETVLEAEQSLAGAVTQIAETERYFDELRRGRFKP